MTACGGNAATRRPGGGNRIVTVAANSVWLRKLGILAALWSALLGGSLAWSLFQIDRAVFDTAAATARTTIRKDLAFRQWGASHGGVFVPIDEHTPPNPYLSVPNRFAVTSTGQLLTLMNPAYMLRQLQERFPGEYGIRSRITSLRPINPNNAPDAWEESALKSFEQAPREHVEVVRIEDAAVLRLMQPFVVTFECLGCHQQHGYKLGDIRGGIGVSVPLAPYLAQEKERRTGLIVSHSLIWLTGLLALLFWQRRDGRHAVALNQAIDAQKQINRLYRLLSEINQLIVRKPEIAQLYQNVCSIAVDKGGFLVAWIGVAGHDGRIHPVACSGIPSESLESLGIEQDGPAAVAIALRESRSEVIADLGRHFRQSRYIDTIRNHHLGSVASIPIRVRNANVAALTLYAREPDFFDAKELALIEELAADVGYALEVAELDAAQAAAQAQLRLSASVFESAHDGIYITAADGTIIDVNPRFCEITGYRRDEVIGQNPRILRSGRHDAVFYAAMWRSLIQTGHWEGEIWNRHANGEVHPQLLSITRLAGSAGETIHYVAVFTDISFLKQQEARLEHLAYHDALTQLPNRLLFADRLEVAMAQARRNGDTLGVAYLDLDGFKPINDQYGHQMGDRLLVEIAERLQQTLRGGDSVARLGGDEFVLLLNKLSSKDECEAILHRLLHRLSEPVIIEDQSVKVTASLGVTLFPEDDADADTLLRHADHALYSAKEGGRNRWHIFDTLHDYEIRARVDGRRRFESALTAGELRLHYQPKVDMRHGQAVGVEALIRWQHPDRGLLTPAAFMPFIENTPVDTALGEWVLREALRQASAWQAAGVKLPISVNISPYHLAETHFAIRLRELLAGHPELPDGSLEIEILESAALQDIGHIVALMHECQALGVGFALDDFGTGYSSLAYFRRLPVDMLKIDQEFVRDMLDNTDDMAIVKGVIGLARAFRREVIAEGVETGDHGLRLLHMGCHLAQGYGIARPMPAEEIPAWLATWRPDRAWILASDPDAQPDLAHLMMAEEN